MLANFEIEGSTALKYEGRHIDLHNNFDFIDYNYISTHQVLKITLAKSLGDWVDKTEYSKLTLIHYNVFFLNISYDNKEFQFPHDDKALADISFFPSSDRGINDRVTCQANPDKDDDIIYMFQSDHYIRVGCDKIELITEL